MLTLRRSRIPCRVRLCGVATATQRTRAIGSRLSSTTNTSELDTHYDPQAVERGKDAWWADKGLYSAGNAESRVPIPSGGQRKTYSMIFPPPNITGKLHIGHALTVSIQDVVARWRRMQGRDVLWVPGLDHAGIATQTVVEKLLQREQGKSRHELGRAAFLDEVWKWHDQYEANISSQLRRLGASLDWDKEYFTLDTQRSEAVVEAFTQLGEMGLLYRASRMINWCPALQTVISDVEVDHVEVDGRTKLPLPSNSGDTDGADGVAGPGFVEVGLIDSFAYPVVETDDPTAAVVGEVVVATTRLETMLGDEAVAVHPDDPRHAAHIGCFVRHPINGRHLPIIADADLVDMEFGTGAVKITPGHDPNDFECSQRHGLPVHNILNGDATIAAGIGCDQYAGMDRFAARAQLRDDLGTRGLYRGSEEHSMTLQVCSRTGDILEPLIRPQWFVKVEGMCERSRENVCGTTNDEKKTAMFPETEVASWNRWLTDPPDWCVSRQLWWGHRIPAYRVSTESTDAIANTLRDLGINPDEPISDPCINYSPDDGLWVVARDADAALDRLAQWVGGVTEEGKESILKNIKLRQDEDVLDTWFSSGLLPLSALGWPASDMGQAEQSLNVLHGIGDGKYYPLSLMETGSDILFFWVARMAMLCTEIEKWHRVQNGQSFEDAEQATQMPFEAVLLHPLVRDKSGKKMSKSLGNVIDPMDVIHGISLDTMQGNLANSNLPSKEIDRASRLLNEEYPEGIPECGADALRFALASYVQHGKPINLDLQRVVAARLFCNKVWQAVRFLDNNVHHSHDNEFHVSLPAPHFMPVAPAHGAWTNDLALSQRWILSRLSATVQSCDHALEKFEFGTATSCLQSFFENDLCDNFIEWSKMSFRHGSVDEITGSPAQNYFVLWHCMETWLRLAHPIAPFITEELWQHMVVRDAPFTESSDQAKLRASNDSLMQYPYPEHHVYESAGYSDTDAEHQMGFFIEAVHSFRSLYQTAQPALGSDYLHKCQAVINVASVEEGTPGGVETLSAVVQDSLASLERFTNIEGGIELAINDAVDNDTSPRNELSRVIEGYDGWSVALRLAPADAADQEHISREIGRMKKRMTKSQRQLSSVEGRLSSEAYRSRASVGSQFAY